MVWPTDANRLTFGVAANATPPDSSVRSRAGSAVVVSFTVVHEWLNDADTPVRPTAKFTTGKLVSPRPLPAQCVADTSIAIAPDGIRFASSTHATGVAPIPGAPDDATGSGLLLGAFDLPCDLPLLPCAKSVV